MDDPSLNPRAKRDRAAVNALARVLSRPDETDR